MGITPRQNRCDPPPSPFLSFTPPSEVVTTTVVPSPYVKIPESGVVIDQNAGSMFFPIGVQASLTINSSTGPLNLLHDQDVLICNGNKLVTITKDAVSSSVVPNHISLDFIDTYLTDIINIEGAFKVTLKTTSNKVIAVKYINDHDDVYELKNASIIFDDSNVVYSSDLNGEYIILEVESLIDNETKEVCASVGTLNVDQIKRYFCDNGFSSPTPPCLEMLCTNDTCCAEIRWTLQDSPCPISGYYIEIS